MTLVAVLGVALIAMAIARTFNSRPPIPVADHTPVETGQPATIALRTTFGARTHGELSAVELDLARGFHFDRRAAATCTVALARLGDCPVTSTIGSGDGTIVVDGTYLPRSADPVDATLYLAPPQHRTDLAGVLLDLYEVQSKLHVTLRGRVAALARGPYGLALRFSRTQSELPHGYDLSLLALDAVIGAHRTVGHTTYDLLTDSSSCSGPGWAIQLLIDSAGQLQVYRGNASCQP
ncbi:MAG: hypothetical protein JOZ07_19025 [Solirubrobacterales bacterium]|nr:hypothetical protein [Solirubrobacterales bacterium]